MSNKCVLVQLAGKSRIYEEYPKKNIHILGNVNYMCLCISQEYLEYIKNIKNVQIGKCQLYVYLCIAQEYLEYIKNTAKLYGDALVYPQS